MPRRHDDLFGQIATFRALHDAARRAVVGKRRKPGAAAFMAGLERELLRLERELNDGSYRTGRYLDIVVRDPKRRIVSAAPFRDRVVHHALFAVCRPTTSRAFGIGWSRCAATGGRAEFDPLRLDRSPVEAPGALERAVFCGATPGTTTRGTCARPTATGTHRTTATTTAVSVLPAPPVPEHRP